MGVHVAWRGEWWAEHGPRESPGPWSCPPARCWLVQPFLESHMEGPKGERRRTQPGTRSPEPGPSLAPHWPRAGQSTSFLSPSQSGKRPERPVRLGTGMRAHLQDRLLVVTIALRAGPASSCRSRGRPLCLPTQPQPPQRLGPHWDLWGHSEALAQSACSRNPRHPLPDLWALRQPRGLHAGRGPGSSPGSRAASGRMHHFCAQVPPPRAPVLPLVGLGSAPVPVPGQWKVFAE